MSTSVTWPSLERSVDVGAWSLTVSPLTGVKAHRRAGGPTFSARLTRFPIGYRVSRHWTDGATERLPADHGIPAVVIKKATALARQLTKEVPW